MTGIGVCALFLVSGAALATDFTWDDTYVSNHNWSREDNWDLNDGIPDDANDRAYIDNSLTPGDWPVVNNSYTIGLLTFADGSLGSEVQIDTSSNTLTVSSAGIYDGKVIVTDTDSQCYVEQLGSGEIDAEAMDIIAGDTASEHAAYELYAGTLDVHGTVTVEAAESVDADATILIGSGTTFTPEAMAFVASATDTNGYAIGDFNESVSVGCCTSAVGYVYITIATAKTVDLNALSLDGNSTHLEVVGEGNDATLRLNCLVDNGQPVTFSGTLDVVNY
jgi:hypothetical protein